MRFDERAVELPYRDRCAGEQQFVGLDTASPEAALANNRHAARKLFSANTTSSDVSTARFCPDSRGRKAATSRPRRPHHRSAGDGHGPTLRGSTTERGHRRATRPVHPRQCPAVLGCVDSPTWTRSHNSEVLRWCAVRPTTGRSARCPRSASRSTIRRGRLDSDRRCWWQALCRRFRSPGPGSDPQWVLNRPARNLEHERRDDRPYREPTGVATLELRPMRQARRM